MEIRGPVRRWRETGKAMRIEVYIRWTMYLMVVLGPLTVPLSLFSPGHRAGIQLLLPLLLAALLLSAVSSVRLVRAGLDHYLARRALPVSALLLSSGAALAAIWGAALIGRHGAVDARPAAVSAVVLLVFWFGPASIALPPRLFAAASATMLLLAYPALVLACESAGTALGVLVGSSLGSMLLAVSCRCSAWVVAVAWELDTARETQTRLAVAEERLRFSRDLHDTLGRNLTAIALKSELAGQLARRGRPEAADQMTEVQRIAQESQREVREVVRGYRDADLAAEVTGARSVLRAAGVHCRVDLDPQTTALAPAVQSVLGWVVREATTNVLRHSEAAEVTLRLRLTDGQAVLELENDGVARHSGGVRGSGLAGLGERLGAHGGELTTRRPEPGRFLLRAELPLTDHRTDRKAALA